MTTTHYVLDPAAGLTQVLSDGTNTYLYGNARLAQYQTAMQYFGADGLGSVRQIYDASAQVVGSSRYDPFGNLMSQSGTATSVFAFAGEQQDATGLQYLRARYYSAAQGRFTTRDVWEGDPSAPMSYDAWLYVYANPVSRVDPSGKQCAGCQPSGRWAEYELFYGYGIRLGSPDPGLGGGFVDADKVLIAETVGDFARLLGGPERFKRNVALTSVRQGWTPGWNDYNNHYDPATKSITLYPLWYAGAVVRAPWGENIIGLSGPCVEQLRQFARFPSGSLPTAEIGAKFTFAHEIGHAFHEGNRDALRDFRQKVSLPPSSLAWLHSNPLISRNAGRFPFEEEVFGDVIAAYLYSRDLLNQQMLTWVQSDMPRTLR